MMMYSAQYARYVHIVFLASFRNPGKMLHKAVRASLVILGDELPRTKDCHGKTGLRMEMSELISG
jgi:hypothetical protein